MQKDDLKTEFLILDFDCNPEEISETLGIKPTEVIRKGDVKRADPSGINPPILYKRNAWVLRLDTAKDESIQEHINNALEILRPKAKVVTNIASRYPGELSIFGFAKDKDRLALHLESKTIKELDSEASPWIPRPVPGNCGIMV